MSANSRIEWTEATWNPWHGCTKVSAGCDNCYMFSEKKRYGQNPEVVVRSKTTFAAPLKWKDGKIVFTCSWSDFFHVDADPWRDEAWEIIKNTPRHTYQILTKRPGRIARHLPIDWGDGYPNVWLGTSVEHQETVYRAGQLAAIPATVRFLSCEPLLGPVSFRWARWDNWKDADGKEREVVNEHDGLRRFFHWVIVGGESGANARPMELDWARTIRDECRESGVAFFLKQLGGHPNKRGHELALLDGKRYVEMPEVAA